MFRRFNAAIGLRLPVPRYLCVCFFLVFFLARQTNGAHTDPFQIMKELPPPEVLYPSLPEPASPDGPATASLKPAINPVAPEPARPPRFQQKPGESPAKGSARPKETGSAKPQPFKPTPPASATARITSPATHSGSKLPESKNASSTPSDRPGTVSHNVPSPDKPPSTVDSGKKPPATSSATIKAKADKPVGKIPATPTASAPATTQGSSSVKIPPTGASKPPHSASLGLASESSAKHATMTASVASDTASETVVTEDPAGDAQAGEPDEAAASETQTAGNPESDTPEGESPPGEGEEAAEGEGEAPSIDEILAEAVEFKKEAQWDSVVSTLAKAGTSTETPVLELRLEALVKQKKLNSQMVRNTAQALLDINPQSSIANYGMGFFFAYDKKPDLSKALTFLAKAKAAKKPFAGSSSLYWQIFLKQKWWLFLLLVGGVGAGVDQWRKKKKKQAEAAGLAALGETPGIAIPPAEGTVPDQPAPPAGTENPSSPDGTQEGAPAETTEQQNTTADGSGALPAGESGPESPSEAKGEKRE